MNTKNLVSASRREFPALNRLIRVYVWMSVVGAVLMAVGLVLAGFWHAWYLAIPPLSGGTIALGGGLWGRFSAHRLIERLRDSRPA